MCSTPYRTASKAPAAAKIGEAGIAVPGHPHGDGSCGVVRLHAGNRLLLDGRQSCLFSTRLLAEPDQSGEPILESQPFVEYLRDPVPRNTPGAGTDDPCGNSGDEQQNWPVPVHDLRAEQEKKDRSCRSDARGERKVLQCEIGQVPSVGTCEDLIENAQSG